jgi:hypothetical protein
MFKKFIHVISLIFLIIVVMPTQQVSATGLDRYVSTSGEDIGDCSSDPCLTFDYVLMKSGQEDLIHIAPGTYPGNLNIETPLIIKSSELTQSLLFGSNDPLYNSGSFGSTPLPLRTEIVDITSFLEKCPNYDPIYSKLRSDFKIRLDGVLINDIPCTEPISAIPIEDFSDALIAIQAFRTTYYMSHGLSDYLPWTSLNLYDWMDANVGGINFKTAPGQLYCCDYINGEQYVSQSLQDDFNRNFKRKWIGISSTIAYYAHEIRHADGGPGHVNGCQSFPNPTDPLGCDADYNLANLGSYGVQHWLYKNWTLGYLNVGVSCESDGGLADTQWLLQGTNGYLDRFVKNIPPVLLMPGPPYGGPCYKPFTISGNVGVGNAVLTYLDETVKEVTADADGNYSLEIPRNWAGSVTPSLAGYVFMPDHRDYLNVTNDKTDQNYKIIGPVLSSIFPTSKWAARPGLTLTVFGTKFTPTSVVRWNGSDRVTTYINSGKLTAVITTADLATASIANVTVFNPETGGGTSAPKEFTVKNEVPKINSLTPAAKVHGRPTFTLTVFGAKFGTGAVVRWNGNDRPTTFVNQGKLTALISAADIAAAGTANITVFNPAPFGGLSNIVIFTIQ